MRAQREAGHDGKALVESGGLVREDGGREIDGACQQATGCRQKGEEPPEMGVQAFHL